jgi:hypothetical protein
VGSYGEQLDELRVAMLAIDELQQGDFEPSRAAVHNGSNARRCAIAAMAGCRPFPTTSITPTPL